jgi:hypothetical protein
MPQGVCESSHDLRPRQPATLASRSSSSLEFWNVLGAVTDPIDGEFVKWINSILNP